MTDIEQLQRMIDDLRRLPNSCEPKNNQNFAICGARTQSPVSFGSSATFTQRKRKTAERTECGT
jgi:hypothetical protein